MATTRYSDLMTSPNKELFHLAVPERAGEIAVVRATVTIAAALTVDDVMLLAQLPPYCIPIDAKAYWPDMDSATSLVWSLGVLDTTNLDLVSSSMGILSSTVGQAAGLAVLNNDDWFFPATYLAETDCPDLSAGLTMAFNVDTAPGTSATSGTIVADILYRSTLFDV